MAEKTTTSGVVSFDREEIKRWIKEGIDSDMISWAKKTASLLARKKVEIKKNHNTGKEYKKHINPMTTSQLRKFFGEVKKIQAGQGGNKVDDSILLLRPKLAYAVGRDNKKTRLEEFYKPMDYALECIDLEDKEQFNRFVKIFESIVAYHKAEGGQ